MRKIGEAGLMGSALLIVALALILGGAGCSSEVVSPPGIFPPDTCWPRGEYSNVAWSPTGEYMAYFYGLNPHATLDTSGIYLYDLSDSTATRLIPANLHYPAPVTPAFSPDGRWLAFSWYQQIWKCLLTGDSLVQLTATEWNFCPAWSPNGRRIAYHSRREDQHGVHIMNSDGSGDAWVPGGYHPQWLDENRIVSSGRAADGRLGILVTNLSSREKSLLFEQLDGWIECCFLAADRAGERLLFHAVVEGTWWSNIWRFDMATSQLTQLTTTGGDEPAWSPDCREIAYTNTRVGRIWIMSDDGSGKRPLFEE
jgi:Tol biopolymer transport system component